MVSDGGDDKYEADGFDCSAKCLVNGSIIAQVYSTNFVKGSYNFNYILA